MPIETYLAMGAAALAGALVSYWLTRFILNKRVADLRSVSDTLVQKRKDFDELDEQTKDLQALRATSIDFQKQISEQEEMLRKLEESTKGSVEKLDSLKLSVHEFEKRADLYSRIDEYIEYGHFESPDYLYETSERFTIEIRTVREEQKKLISSKMAVTYPDGLHIKSPEKTQGQVLSGHIKLMLAAFNIECDLLIGKVSPSNFERTLERIEKKANSIEKLWFSLYCGFNIDYVKLKYEECKLQYQFKLKQKEEQEEQRMIREQIREEQKARKEYERMIAQAEKEEKMYRDLLEKAREELSKSSAEERVRAEERIAELERQLNEAEQKEARAKSMAEQTRRGHVYIISNIGSFGKDVYKIGLTRRLDPMDRVKELGDASVPFSFDVHAIVYAEDAPTLETELHRYFNKRRVNAVNYRKEFFKVSLTQVREAVEELTGEAADFRMTAIAEEYYETRRLLSSNDDSQAVVLS